MVTAAARTPSAPPAPLAAVERRLAVGDGLELAASLWQPPTESGQRPVLFAHGFAQIRGAWTHSAQALAARGHAVLCYDARGHGGSDRNPDGLAYHGEQFADDLARVARGLPAPPVLVGASMGGLFGLLAQARDPQLFAAMVLVDITPRWEPAGLERILGFVTAFPDGFDSLAQVADVIARYLPQRQRKDEDELRAVLRQGADGRWHWHWDRRLVDDLVRDSARHQDDIAAAARAVRCPLLLVSGGRSELVSARTIDEFRALAPHARHAQLAQASHMLAGDDNDAFTRTVLDYLATLPAVRPGERPSHLDAADDPATGVRP
ncbi:MAG: alpha/beta hydrolase [Pseudoxanthomonas sp.]